MSAVGSNTIQVCIKQPDGWHLETTTPYDGNVAWNYGLNYDQAHEYTGQPCAGTPATLPATGGATLPLFMLAIGLIVFITWVIWHD